MARTSTNTLEYNPALCVRCGLCSEACPHRVFARCDGGPARLVDPGACMECGACALNCEPGAITVNSDVGCASAMIMAALKGSKAATCC